MNEKIHKIVHGDPPQIDFVLPKVNPKRKCITFNIGGVLEQVLFAKLVVIFGSKLVGWNKRKAKTIECVGEQKNLVQNFCRAYSKNKCWSSFC
jgi:hypothetical protein